MAPYTTPPPILPLLQRAAAGVLALRLEEGERPGTKEEFASAFSPVLPNDNQADTGAADTGRADTGAADSGAADSGAELSASDSGSDADSRDESEAADSEPEEAITDTGAADTEATDTGRADSGAVDTRRAESGSESEIAPEARSAHAAVPLYSRGADHSLVSSGMLLFGGEGDSDARRATGRPGQARAGNPQRYLIWHCKGLQCRVYTLGRLLRPGQVLGDVWALSTGGIAEGAVGEGQAAPSAREAAGGQQGHAGQGGGKQGGQQAQWERWECGAAALEDVPTARSNHAMAACGEHLLVFGGWGQGGATPLVFPYKSSTHRQRPLHPALTPTLPQLSWWRAGQV
ncbi:hypothetical protein T492DRAFT_850757 [Pavlovales sp. CCMP2436]|nr:hypothetical protein T492DRAFT_850757 [Pavlovales sp. CCMP2436]